MKSYLIPAKHLYILPGIQLLLLSSVLQNEPRMGQRNNRLKKPVFFIQRSKELKILLSSNTNTPVCFKTKSQLLFYILNNKGHDAFLQFFIIIVIHVNALFCKAQRTDSRNKIIAVKLRRTAILFYYFINEFGGEFAAVAKGVNDPQLFVSCLGPVKLIPVIPPPNLPGLIPNSNLLG